MSEYPKVIFTGGVKVVVKDAKDEARWCAPKVDAIAAPAEAPEPVEPDEPEPKKKTKSHKKT